MEFAVLGGLRVTGSSGVIDIHGAKERLLLAHLVSKAGRTVGVDELVEGLWGERPPRTAVKSLQTYVLRLRNTLEPDRVGAPALLVTDDHGYRLAVHPQDVDADRFVQLTGAAEHGRPRDRLQLLEEALALWRGPAYAGLASSAHLAAAATRLDGLRLAAQEDKYAVELDVGRTSAVVAELERLVTEHPMRERLWGLLITGLYRAGRQAEALAAYERARALLADELGIDPGPELRELHTRVLKQDPSLRRDAARASVPAALLTGSDVLYGRDAELAVLRGEWERARSGAARVVAVRGPLGSGRRSLAGALAEEVAGAGGGVQYVGAAGPDPQPPRDLPDLLVVDRVARPAGEPTLTVLLLPPSAHFDPDATVLDLPPLDRDAVRSLVSGYVGEPDLEAATDVVLAESGGWPSRAHAAAVGHVRATAAVAVRAAAAEADRSHTSLLMARSRLTAGVLDLARAEPRDDAAASRCPWPGLAAYDITDGAWFAGRERLVAELVAKISGASCLAVVGASGSGKSSAVRAGLLAGLADDRLPGSAGWDVVLLRPGSHPMRELAHRFAETRGADAGALLERIVRSPEDGEARSVLVVDQFEEVWTACADEGERHAFLDTLADLASSRDHRVTVVLVLRADYVDRLADHSGLATIAADDTVLVGAPNRDDVRRVIERPARRAGLEFDDGLVDAVIADAGAEPGLLPLLSTSLAQLWSSRDGRRLTFDAYVGFGGLSGAIGHLAEQVWAELDDPGRLITKSLLLRLTGPGDGAQVARRRVSTAELAGLPQSDVAPIVERLAGARLLSLSDGYVEVAHEALFREWPRLRAWLTEDAAGRAVQRRLAVEAAEWDASGREASLLWRGARLDAGLEVAAARPEEVAAHERAFLDAGRDAAEEARRSAERRAEAEARMNRRLRSLLVAAAALLLLALVAGALAMAARGRADDEARSAEVAAVAADARRLAASALSVEYPDLALLTAVEATRREPSPETYGALLTLLSRQPDVVTRFRTAARFLRGGASANGRTVYLGENGPVLRALDAETGQQRWARELPGRVGTIAPSPDGRALAVTIGAPTEVLVTVLNPATGEEVWRIGTADARRLAPRTAPYFWENLAWGADGRLVFANDSHIFWATSDGQLLDSLRWPRPVLDTITFEVWPDRRVSTGPSQAGPGVVVDPAGRRTGVRTTRGAVMAVSPDGSRLVEVRQAEEGVTVRLLDGASLEPRSAAWPVDGFVGRVLFSPDGQQFAMAVDEEVLLRDGRTAAPVRTLVGHSGVVLGLAYAGRDQDLLWTAGRDGSAVAFDVSGARGVIGTVRILDSPHTGEQAADSSAAIWTNWDERAPNRAFLRREGERRGSPLPVTGLEGCQCTATATELTRDGRTALVGMEIVKDLFPVQDRGHVVVYDAPRRAVRAIVDTPWPVHGIGAMPDGTAAVVTGSGGWGVLDLKTLGLEVVDSTPGDYPHEAVASVEVTDDGQRAVILRSPEVVLIDVDSRTVLATRDLVAEANQQPFSVAWSRDGESMAVGTNEGWLFAMDGHTLEDVAPRRLITGGYVTDVEVSPDGRTAATMGSDGDVTLWDAETWRPFGQPLLDDRGWGYLSFDQDSKVLRVSYEDRTQTHIDVRPEAWVRAACAAANRDLTPEESAIIRPGRALRPTCA